MTGPIVAGWYLLIGMSIASWSWQREGHRVLGYLSLFLKTLCFLVYAAIWPVAVAIEIRRKLKTARRNCDQCPHPVHRGRCSEKVRRDVPGRELVLESGCPCGAERVTGLGQQVREM